MSSISTFNVQVQSCIKGNLECGIDIDTPKYELLHKKNYQRSPKNCQFRNTLYAQSHSQKDIIIAGTESFKNVE